MGAQSSAAPAPAAPLSKQCVQLEVPLLVTANNSEFDLPRVDSNIDAVDWVWDLTTWSHGGENGRVTGVIPVNETFTISAQLCVPPQGTKADILQIATHGIGFDKRYWDVEINPDEYSYVDSALRHGYSILTYDRLGTGNSTKADAYEILQAGVEIEVLRGLTQLARTGELVQVSDVVGASCDDISVLENYTPHKVTHIGHSYGSFMTSGLLSRYGNLSDGAILTGFLINEHLLNEVGPEAFGFEFAAESDPDRFADRPSGYIVAATESNIQQIFLKKGLFEPELLRYAELIKQPNAVAELISGNQAFGRPATDFKGPLQVGDLFLLLSDSISNHLAMRNTTLCFGLALEVADTEFCRSSSAKMTTRSAMVTATTSMTWGTSAPCTLLPRTSPSICSQAQVMG